LSRHECTQKARARRAVSAYLDTSTTFSGRTGIRACGW
jgi:hypothetical protein